MDEIIDKINLFFKDKKAHVLLIEGKWGVGKTFIVNKWLENYKNNKDIHIIKLSLFGMSTVLDLNTQLLEEAFLFNKLNKKIKEITFNGDFSASKSNITYSFGLSLSGLFSLLAKKEYAANKKRENIIIIDDIERKDNQLTLNQIFGFVDSLKLENTKIIMIANCDILNKDPSFKFKEKLVDKEIKIKKPMREAIENILPESIRSNINIDYCFNLRTLKKFVDLYNDAYEKNKKIDIYTLNIIFVSLIKINDDIFDRKKLIEIETNLEKHVNDLVHLQTNKDINYDEIKKKIEEKYSVNSFSEVEVLFEFIKDNKFYSNLDINELKKGVNFIYESIQNEKYLDAFNYKFKYQDIKRKKKTIEVEKIFFSNKPNQVIHDLLDEIFSLCVEDGYDYIEICRKFKNILDYHYNPTFYDKKNNKKINKIIMLLSEKIANQIIDSNIKYCAQIDCSFNKNESSKKLDEMIMKMVEKKYKIRFNKMIKLDSYIGILNDEINNINIIMNQTKLTFDINLKESLYKKAIDRVIVMTKKDITNTWHDIHKLFDNISRDNDIQKETIADYIISKISNNKIQKYRLNSLINQYLKK